PFDNVRAEVVDELPEIENEMLIGMNQRDPSAFDCYRLNIVTGELQLVAENPGNVTRWFNDHTGAVRIAIATDGVNTTLMARDDDSGPFREVLTTHFKESLDPLFYTFD